MSKGLYINPTTFVPLSQISEGLNSEIATRNFAMGGYVGFFNYLPDPDPILRKLGTDQSVYKDLMADEQVAAMVMRRKNLTKSLNWDLDYGEGATDKEMELCRFTLKVLQENGCKIKDLISQSLNPIMYGYSPFEIIYEKIGNYILPIRVQEKPREYFVFDGENQLRLRTIDNYDGIVVRGKDADPKIAAKFILLQNEATYENPYGDKAISRCFWPVTFKRGGMRFFATFIEKYGMPFIFGKLPRGAKPEDHYDLMSKLSNMIQDAVGTGPDDSSIQILEPKGSNAGDLHEKFLNRCDNSISKAILTNALSTERQGTGSYASTETGASTIEGNLADEDKDFPSELFDEIFKRTLDINLGTGKYITFRVFEDEDVNKPLADRDAVLADKVGVSFTRKHIREKYNLDDDDFQMKSEIQPQKPTEPSIFIPDDKSLLRSQFSNPLKNFFHNIFGKRIELSEGTITNNIADQLSTALPDKLLQFAAEETLRPVIELANNSNSREEFLSSLALQFPKMKTDQLESLVTKALFIAEIEGRIEGSN